MEIFGLKSKHYFGFLLISIFLLVTIVDAQKNRKKTQTRKNQLFNKYHANVINPIGSNFDPDNGNFFFSHLISNKYRLKTSDKKNIHND